MPEKQAGSDGYITTIEPETLLWQFVKYDAQDYINLDLECSNKQFRSESELFDHFSKHQREFNGIYSNSQEYLAGANDVINFGYKVIYEYKGKQNEGYVKFMGNKCGVEYDSLIKNKSKKDMGLPKDYKFHEAKFEFVAIRDDGSIATYHIKSSANLFEMLNQNKKVKDIKMGLK